MIDISIIVPIYNAEKYLNKCIKSLINQTKENLEFILVNDGSTDSSEEIIKSYKDKRIKYFKNKNQGIGKTRNFGIKQAKGKYIMFLDSDDYLATNACEELFSKAEKDNLDLVINNFYRVEEETEKKVEVIIPEFKDTPLKDNKRLLLDVNLAPWNKLYKRELLKKNKIQFVEDLKYEDAPFVVEAMDKAKKIGHIKKFLNYYVIHKNSETTVRDEKIFDIIEIVDKIRKYFSKRKEFTETVDKLSVRILTNYTIQQRVQQDKEVGMQFIDRAFQYMKANIPDYQDNKYYNNRGILRRTIEKSKILTKLYCNIYRKKKKIDGGN